MHVLLTASAAETGDNGNTIFNSGEVTATLQASPLLAELDDASREKLSNAVARGVAFWDQAVTQGSLESQISLIDIPTEGQAVRGNSGSGTANRTGRIEIDPVEFASISQLEADRLLAKTLGANLGLPATEGTVTQNGGTTRAQDLENLFDAGPSDAQLALLQEIGLRPAAASGQPTGSA